jgi:hypothetical protein
MLTKESDYTWTVLNTPPDIEFLDFRIKHRQYWLTSDRRILQISNMTGDHIAHSIALLERAGQQHTESYKGLCAELESRRREYNL